jgi:carbohydrate diacid regulator
MFELDHLLAQNIVDRAMAILPYNVNVMDNQGLILGSGESNRINTRHEGAQLVLANHRVVEIDEQAAQNLKGVQAGINLPLMHDGRLIGVLGITGEPQTLRTYAELVRMTAEMLVAQSHMQIEQQWRKQRSEDVLAMLLGEAGSSPRLVDEARQLGLKPQLVRTPLLIKLDDELTSSALADWLKSRYPDSWCLSPSPSSLLWCCPSSLIQRPEKILEKLESQGWKVALIACGIRAETLEDLRRGYRRVAELLAYAEAVRAQQKFLPLARYQLPSFLWAHREDGVVDALLAPLLEIQAKDSSGQLMRTLRAWCLHHGQAQPCAEALGIHRNSLRYRLERITELSGKDMTRLDELLELYLGVLLLPHTESAS